MPPSESPPHRGEGVVLIAEDERELREVLTEILQFAGYSTESTTNGSEALQALERISPVLILLDMRMPILDGWGFARELKRRGIKIPIVAVTAAQNARAWSQEIEADGFLAKPFELDDLLRLVSQYVDR
jgi:CheY-like chemotaxis protein